MNFKNWVKSIQTAGYNGERMVGSFGYLNRKLYNPKSLARSTSLADVDLLCARAQCD